MLISTILVWWLRAARGAHPPDQALMQAKANGAAPVSAGLSFCLALLHFTVGVLANAR